MKPIIEPIVTTAADLDTIQTALEQKPITAMVWVGECERKAPNGQLIEMVFYLAHNTQGFSGTLERNPNAPVYWFPWGQPYRFVVVTNPQDQPQQKAMYFPDVTE